MTTTDSIHPPIPLSTIKDNRETALREDGSSIAYTNFVASIREVGLIQPLVLVRNSDATFELAAGGRRIKALADLGFSEVYHGTTCDPAHPGFVFADELTREQILEIEFDENIQRLNVPWQTEALQIVKIHEARSKNAALAGERWGYRQTGALLNVSTGDMSNMFTIVTALRAKDKEIMSAPSVTEALRIFMQRRVDEANAILVKRGLSSEVNTKVPPNITTDTGKRRSGEIVVLFDDEEDPTSRSINEQNLTGAPGVDADGQKTTIVPLSKMLFLGALEEVVPREFPDNFFDLGAVDIPYGINMENLDLRKQERVDKEHDVEENLALMPKVLEQYYRTLKEGAYLFMFYDLDHHEKLRDWALKVGFKVQRWPLIWCKTHPCKNNSPQYNFTKNYECCYVFRKGNTTLNRPQNTSWFPFDGAVERKMYDNPFAKPFDMWKVIFDAAGLPGMKVADFCCGEGSSLRAAIMCGLMPYGVEISELHYNPLVENIKNAYKTLTRGKVEFQ